MLAAKFQWHSQNSSSLVGSILSIGDRHWHPIFFWEWYYILRQEKKRAYQPLRRPTLAAFARGSLQQRASFSPKAGRSVHGGLHDGGILTLFV